jgi:hypothetical protein
MSVLAQGFLVAANENTRSGKERVFLDQMIRNA